MIKWAFEVQDQIRADTAKDPTAAARYVKQRFPELAQCVGSPEAKSKLNKSLRWSVANNIHVLTPQLFVDNTKLCDEDVDLGLEFALTIMLDRHDKGTLAPPPSARRRHRCRAPAHAEPANRRDQPTSRAKPKTKPACRQPRGDKPADEPATPPADKPADADRADKPMPTSPPTSRPTNQRRPTSR